VSGEARRPPRARYLPIAEHGLIGDLHTVALVGTEGTIDWYCCPRFDSPSVFAAILDADRGGLFRISPDGDGWTSKQLYLPDTNILITRFLMPDGVGEVQDFMPPARAGEAAHRHRMIRRVLAVREEMRFVVDVAPRFDYARARHEVALTPHGALFRSAELGLRLSTRWPLEIMDGRDVRARITLPLDGGPDRIYSQIMERGWHPGRRAFVQHYDTDVLDASVLLMPLCKFIAPTDPRWISTLDAITAELVSDSLVYRYNVDAAPDGLAGKEATFSLCSFWWVEALARAGRLDQARLAFEKMLTYANHLGLYAEEIGPTGEQLGNFPQAFTHLALISAAYNLDRQLG
jgi:GH15 family glucan-1,4-alpha-glucosidase